MVKRLRRCPLKAKSGVRFPLEVPDTHAEERGFFRIPPFSHVLQILLLLLQQTFLLSSLSCLSCSRIWTFQLPKPQTQREIASARGISRSYVSRIEKKALEKLRDSMTEKGMTP